MRLLKMYPNIRILQLLTIIATILATTTCFSLPAPPPHKSTVPSDECMVQYLILRKKLRRYDDALALESKLYITPAAVAIFLPALLLVPLVALPIRHNHYAMKSRKALSTFREHGCLR